MAKSRNGLRPLHVAEHFQSDAVHSALLALMLLVLLQVRTAACSSKSSNMKQEENNDDLNAIFVTCLKQRCFCHLFETVPCGHAPKESGYRNKAQLA